MEKLLGNYFFNEMGSILEDIKLRSFHAFRAFMKSVRHSSFDAAWRSLLEHERNDAVM